MKLIIIAGMPATGKSTLARALSENFSFPVLEKDDIKEEMFDTVGYRDLTEKRALDVAANAILLRCTEAGGVCYGSRQNSHHSSERFARYEMKDIADYATQEDD